MGWSTHTASKPVAPHRADLSMWLGPHGRAVGFPEHSVLESKRVTMLFMTQFQKSPFECGHRYHILVITSESLVQPLLKGRELGLSF